MLGEERKQNHIKCPVKTREGRKGGRKDLKNKCNVQKTVTNMVDINSTIQ